MLYLIRGDNGPVALTKDVGDWESENGYKCIPTIERSRFSEELMALVEAQDTDAAKELVQLWRGKRPLPVDSLHDVINDAPQVLAADLRSVVSRWLND